MEGEAADPLTEKARTYLSILETELEREMVSLSEPLTGTESVTRLSALFRSFANSKETIKVRRDWFLQVVTNAADPEVRRVGQEAVNAIDGTVMIGERYRALGDQLDQVLQAYQRLRVETIDVDSKYLARMKMLWTLLEQGGSHT